MLEALAAPSEPHVRVTLTNVTLAVVEEVTGFVRQLGGYPMTVEATLSGGGSIKIEMPATHGALANPAEVREWAKQYSTAEAVGEALKDIQATGGDKLEDRIIKLKEKRAARERKQA
jgi:hypothetical protein